MISSYVQLLAGINRRGLSFCTWEGNAVKVQEC